MQWPWAVLPAQLTESLLFLHTFALFSDTCYLKPRFLFCSLLLSCSQLVVNFHLRMLFLEMFSLCRAVSVVFHSPWGDSRSLMKLEGTWSYLWFPAPQANLGRACLSCRDPALSCISSNQIMTSLILFIHSLKIFDSLICYIGLRLSVWCPFLLFPFFICPSWTFAQRGRDSINRYYCRLALWPLFPHTMCSHHPRVCSEKVFLFFNGHHFLESYFRWFLAFPVSESDLPLSFLKNKTSVWNQIYVINKHISGH